jgi:hypothetical protein
MQKKSGSGKKSKTVESGKKRRSKNGEIVRKTVPTEGRKSVIPDRTVVTNMTTSVMKKTEIGMTNRAEGGKAEAAMMMMTMSVAEKSGRRRKIAVG